MMWPRPGDLWGGGMKYDQLPILLLSGDLVGIFSLNGSGSAESWGRAALCATEWGLLSPHEDNSSGVDGGEESNRTAVVKEGTPATGMVHDPTTGIDCSGLVNQLIRGEDAKRKNN